MAGTFETPPKALVSFYGNADLVGKWYSEPDPFYCKQPMVTEEDPRRHSSGPPVSNSSEREDRAPFYLSCRQQGIWPIGVGGVDPKDDPDFFVPYCPDQNVSPTYPPTLLLHGTNDTGVHYDLSVRMAAALEAGDIEHELITIAKVGNGFDGNAGDPDQIDAAWERVYVFLDEHV